MKQKIHALGWFLILFCGLGTTPLAGQSKSKPFRFPDRVVSSDYHHGHVLVKLKPEYVSLFQTQANPTAAIPESIGVRSVREMMPEKSFFKSRTRKGPSRSRSHVNPLLYHVLTCQPGQDIESFINNLYKTGYFEVVEPDYVYQMDFDPLDPLRTSQYYLTNIKAYEAWDVTQGSQGITIAIVDTGGDLLHEDLVGNLYTNSSDPIDGIDNDNNGYTDDFQGWDFMGADTLNINDPNFPGDNNPQLTAGGPIAHGVGVAGCASASTNNSKGISGVGFKTKIMFTKHTADNQKPNSAGIYLGYEGIYYAAISGANIINCSWGGAFRSEIFQDLINMVTLDLGSLVVAAAGNDNSSQPFYPAAYDNVLSVAAVGQSGTKASFSNYGTYIDIAAPGVAIFTTDFNNSYKSTQGTSFSSPIVAGAAALVLAQFPTYTPQQVAEQLRVTANSTKLNSMNPGFIGKMGKGILDIHAALTQQSPSIRASKPKLVNASGAPAEPGQTGFLTFSFKNVLASTSSALEISITESSSLVEVLKGTVKPGIIPAGATVTNSLNPFELQISATVPENFSLPVTISYQDGQYVDQEVVTFILNPTFIDVDENLVTTTVSGIGRLGFEDPDNSTNGSGFVFDGNSLLYEMGIIMGSGTGAQLFNNVRATANGPFDQDFIPIGNKIKKITPGVRSTSEIFGSVSNSATPGSQSFQLKYRSLAWKAEPYDKFVIMEYIISNPTASAITNFHFGLFADWDITQNGAEDAAKWENDLKLGVIYPALTAAKPHVGLQLLTGTPEYYAIDNDPAVGDLIGLYDGFTDAEKFQSISGGLARLEAGTSSGTGKDVSHVVGSGPYTIPAGQEIKIAFALHAAPNLADLRESSKYADSVYNYTLNAPVPVINEVAACYDDPATLTATGAPSYKWYKSFTGGTVFHTGSTLTTGNLHNDTTFYVSNAEHSYESVRGIANIIVKANPTISTSGSPIICSDETITLFVADADSYLWSTGATTKTIEVSLAGTYTVTVQSTTPTCISTSPDLIVVSNPAPTAQFTSSGELKSRLPIQFTDQSTGAVSWFWDFGDGTTSTEQNPAITYALGQLYEVTLQVTSDMGCHHTITQSIDVITGLESSSTPGDLIEVYPNPFQSSVLVSFDQALDGPRTIEVLTLQGSMIFCQEGIVQSCYEIRTSEFAPGIYVLRVASGNRVHSRKIVKMR